MQYSTLWTLDFFFVFRKVSYCQKNIKKTLSLKFSLLLFYHKNSRRYERFKQPWLYLILLILDKFSISQSILKVHKRQTTFWKFEKKAHLMLHNLSEAILCTRFQLILKHLSFVYSRAHDLPKLFNDLDPELQFKLFLKNKLLLQNKRQSE